MTTSLQIRTHRVLQLTDHRQRHVALQVALVELVEHDDADVLEESVADEVAREDALGEEPEAGRRAARAGETDAIADLVADLRAALARHELRRGAGRDPARLDHDDLLPTGEPGIEERRRHPRRLPRPRRRPQHHAVGAGQCRDDVGQQRIDRQALRHRRTMDARGGPDNRPPKRRGGIGSALGIDERA